MSKKYVNHKKIAKYIVHRIYLTIFFKKCGLLRASRNEKRIQHVECQQEGLLKLTKFILKKDINYKKQWKIFIESKKV